MKFCRLVIVAVKITLSENEDVGEDKRDELERNSEETDSEK